MSAHLSVIAAALLLFAFACGPTPDPGRDPDASLPDPQADSGVDAGGEDPADAGVDAGIFPRPDTFLLSRPQNFTTSPDAAFTFVANATGRSFECSLDSAQFSACTSPFKTTALADGPHDFKVRALDANGEPDLTPDQDSWTVDTVVPDTTITAAPTGDVTEPRGTVVMSCDEADCLFECALNGGAYFPCTSPHSFEGLSSGAQSVLIRASDRAGNADATPASASWNVLPGEVTVRIAAANLSSGNGQSYDTGHGIRIFQGLGPDIVLIQELNYGQNTPVDIRAFVDTAFSPSFSYFRENNTLPNGVISRFPIVASGVWDDTLVTNRNFAWARINLPDRGTSGR